MAATDIFLSLSPASDWSSEKIRAELFMKQVGSGRGALCCASWCSVYFGQITSLISGPIKYRFALHTCSFPGN